MMQRPPEVWAKILDFCGLEQRYGLPEGLLTEVCRVESAGDPNAVSPTGARGLFQWLRSSADQPGFGIEGGFDPDNPFVAAPKAAEYLGVFMERYNGDLAKTLVAYNQGPGTVDRLIQNYGNNWLVHAPAEGQNYVAKIMPNFNYVERLDVQFERAAQQDWRNKQTEQQAAAENNKPEGDIFAAFLAGLFAMIADIFGKDQHEERVNEPESGRQRVADNTTQQQDREALAREQADALGAGEEKYQCANEAAVGSPSVPNHASSQEQCGIS